MEKMEGADDGLCPAEALGNVVEQMRADNEAGLAALSLLFRSYPLDPRLHFLQGSVLAGMQRYVEGRRAMARAIEIAPEFALARFQLGFLDLTSGRAIDAVGVWSALAQLPEDEPLRLLSEGLSYMAMDNFSEARRLLKKGMELNKENPLINADMQLILDEIADLPDHAMTTEVAADAANPLDEPAPHSAVDQLLRQSRLSGGSKTKH